MGPLGRAGFVLALVAALALAAATAVLVLGSRTTSMVSPDLHPPESDGERAAADEARKYLDAIEAGDARAACAHVGGRLVDALACRSAEPRVSQGLRQRREGAWDPVVADREPHGGSVAMAQQVLGGPSSLLLTVRELPRGWRVVKAGRGGFS